MAPDRLSPPAQQLPSEFPIPLCIDCVRFIFGMSTSPHEAGMGGAGIDAAAISLGAELWTALVRRARPAGAA